MAGATAAAWAAAEAAWMYRIRRHEVPVRWVAGAAPAQDLTVLHISDMHLLPHQTARREFLHSLRERTQPDLVVLTGDAIASPHSIPALLDAIRPLLDLPGVFVFGSNDYFGPRPRNPLKYFLGASAPEPEPELLPSDDLAAALEARGWVNLNNARAVLDVGGLRLSFVGVDDPHIERDEFPADDGVRGEFHIGVAHAPYTRVLDAFRADGAVAAFFGHTHGGQINLPGYGALVTNCDIPTWRARGLQGWPGPRPDGLAVEPRFPFARIPDFTAAGMPTHLGRGVAPMWVNISGGVGTSPYAPIRLACRPEVSVLRFVAVPSGS